MNGTESRKKLRERIARLQANPDVSGLESALAIINLSATLDEARERVAIHIRELKQ